MKDVLSLFNNIEIKNTTRIKGDDLIFCEMQDNIYKQSYEAYDYLANKLQSLNDNEIKEFNTKFNYTNGTSYNYTYTNAISYELRGTSRDNFLNKLNDNLVSGITSYFSNVYNVDIDYEIIKKKSKDKKIDYNFILDLIFEQLGGFGFEDKATQQITEKLKNMTKQYEKEVKKVIVKNKKLTINSFVHEDWYSAGVISYSSRDNIEVLFNALNLFCDNEQDNIYGKALDFNHMGEYDNLGFKYCTGFKVFKNGRIDISFTEGIKALEFANTYTSYAINN